MVVWWILLVAFRSRLLFRISFGILNVLSSCASAGEFQNLSDFSVPEVVTARPADHGALSLSGRCHEGHHQPSFIARDGLVKFVDTVTFAVFSDMRLGLRSSVGTRLLKYEAIDILTYISAPGP